MTMFEELFALASSATLTLTISADEATGRMTINVLPKPRRDVAEPALMQALSLTATPQEFDGGFVAALSGYRASRQSLEQQAEATWEVIEAARAASVKKASDTTMKVSKPIARSTGAVHAPSAAASHGLHHADPEAVEDSEVAGEAERSGQGDPVGMLPAGGENYDLFG